MPSTYLCQMVGYDDPDEWHEIPSHSPPFAATRFAYVSDSQSGGELFQNERSRQTVRVRQDLDAVDATFEVSMYFDKVFLAQPR